jgi:hypothetical protein
VTGHIFHPGHQSLHGVTVVLETQGPRTYVGRFDTQDEAGVHLLDVAIHEAAAGRPSKDEYLRRTAKFGVRAEQKHVLVPAGDVAKITPLGDVMA